MHNEAKVNVVEGTGLLLGERHSRANTAFVGDLMIAEADVWQALDGDPDLSFENAQESDGYCVVFPRADLPVAARHAREWWQTLDTSHRLNQSEPKGATMNVTSIVVCEDNVPTDVAVFASDQLAHAHLLKHYRQIWKTAEATGDLPETWQEIRDELQAQDRLADRDVAHIQQHDFDAFA